MRDDRTLFLFIFRNEHIRVEEPKSILRDAFADSGWEWPQIEKELERTSDLYFDTVSQIQMDRWTKGRTALVGDAVANV